jgi:hypothetical protein
MSGLPHQHEAQVLCSSAIQRFLGKLTELNTVVRSESRCALRLQYVDLIVSIEVAIEVCCCFTVFSF